MILANANVMCDDFTLRVSDIEITDGIITKVGTNLPGCSRLDLHGKFILPGFIDTHIHGAYGIRISDPAPDVDLITTFEATQGVTALAITTATSEFSDILRQIHTAKEAATHHAGAKIVGIHAEGPFISPKYKGAMTADYILPPNIDKLESMIEAAGGLLKIITIAPEQPCAIDLISYAVSRGLTVSIGHSNATYEDTLAAINAGASALTHTFNAMRPLNHREPGILGAALSVPSITCEVICDYVHLHPSIVLMIYTLKGKDHMRIISDSGHAAGMNVSEFMVDGQMRYVKDGVVRLADGTIAGSAKTMLDGVRNLFNSGVPLEDISQMASLNPAKSLGIDHITGSITIGKSADLVVLDQSLNVINTYVNGECVYEQH